jgi:hypothetical protein
MFHVTPQVVLVEDATIYRETRYNHEARLLLNQRPKILASGQPFLAMIPTPAPAYSFFADRFVSVTVDLEVIGANEIPANLRHLSMLIQPSTRLDDPYSEDQFHRVSNVTFFTVQQASAQVLMVTVVEIPDLCDNPWLEWVPPPTDHAFKFMPFRQIYSSGRAQPFQGNVSIFTRQYQTPIDAEIDALRPTKHDIVFAPFRMPQVMNGVPQPFPTGAIVYVRVKAIQVGFYNNQTRNLGDVFDVDTNFLASSIIDYLPTGDYDYGWMLIVPSSTALQTNAPTPLSSTDIPRTVY